MKYNLFKKKYNNNSSSSDNHCNGNTQHWQGCGIEKRFNNSIKIILTHFLENKSALKNVWNLHLCNNYTSNNLREEYERKHKFKDPNCNIMEDSGERAKPNLHK